MSANNWFIACNNFNTPTARELAIKLGIGFGQRPKRSRTKIIRWGFSSDFENRRHDTHYFPSNESIANCANKLSTLRILKEHDVSVPDFYTNETQLRNAEYPLYSRRHYHTRGKDIVIVNNNEEALRNLAQGRYLVESIPYKKEYRVHIFNDVVISCSKKYFRQQLWEELGSPAKKDIIRNNEYGWGYYDFEDIENCPQSVRDEAIKAVTALNLIWGAVDLIRTPDNDIYVFEVNSAPGLRDARVDLYANKFKELMQENE